MASTPGSGPTHGPPQQVTVAVRLPESSEFPRPEAANFFQFSWGGPDVQMLIGYLDMVPRPVGLGTSDQVVSVEPLITHRLFMSIQGFALLKGQLDELAGFMKAAGVPLEQLNPAREGPK